MRCLIALAALAPGGGAAAQSVPEGIYITEVRETASALELNPDGHFRWMFTTGALDMMAEGRWRRDGGDVLLDTEPPVAPPRFELLGAGREAAPALVVRIADAHGATPPYLDVEATYDSGAPGYAHLDEDAYRFAPARGRRIVAIRVGSAGFGFWSERHEVPAEANLMRFRFFPGDLGRADFRSARATIDGNALTLDVLGHPLRYRRLTGEENAELQTAIAETGAAAPPAPPALPVGPVGPVEVAIGTALDPALARSFEVLGAGFQAGSGPMELRYRFGERVIDFGRVGGSGWLPIAIHTGPPAGEMVTLAFSYQDRLLTLEEALERAQGLESWLSAGGFEARPATGGWPDPAPFEAMVHARDGDPAFRAADIPIRAADWAAAGRMAADPAIGVLAMHLFTLRAGDIHATALLHNMPGLSARDSVQVPLDQSGGRAWVLNVTITRDPALIEREPPPDE